MPQIIYIAGPYSNNAPIDAKKDASPKKREARVNAVTEIARQLVEDGKIVYSPLTMTHPIDIRMGKNPDSAFWVAFDEAFMAHCSRIVVLKLPGWDGSSGVEREIEYFKQKGIAAEWLEPSDFGITKEHEDFAAAFD